MRRLAVSVNRRPRVQTSLSVGLILVLLVAALLIYRQTASSTLSLAADLPTPDPVWTLPLAAAPTDAATTGKTSFVLTHDKLGSAAVLIVDERGLLTRTDSLASRGRYRLQSTALGVLCIGLDDGRLVLYHPTGVRAWQTTFEGTLPLAVADSTGVSVVIGPKSGGPPGDLLVILSRDGRRTGQWLAGDGAITALARGAGTTVAAVFSADPTTAAEQLVIIAPDSSKAVVSGRGFGTARLAVADGKPIVAAGDSLAAYDRAGRRLWRVAIDAPSALAAADDAIVTLAADRVTCHDLATGRQRWRRTLTGAPRALSIAGDQIIVKADSGILGCDSRGRPTWALTGRPPVSASAQGSLLLCEEETATLYRTR